MEIIGFLIIQITTLFQRGLQNVNSAKRKGIITKRKINSIVPLVAAIQKANTYFQNQVQKQVNIALTLRNWITGYYIVESEQNGKLTAEYGEGLIDNLALKLKARGLKGFSAIALRTYRAFYLTYPQIQQTVSVELRSKK